MIKRVLNNPQVNLNGVRILDIFENFLTDYGYTEVYYNEGIRNDKGSYHNAGVGLALDIHYVAKKPYQEQHVHFSNYRSVNQKFYNQVEDIKFFNKCLDYFGDSLLEYLSPAKIYIKGYTNRQNNNRESLDIQHQTHLHIAINPDTFQKQLEGKKKEKANFGIDNSNGNGNSGIQTQGKNYITIAEDVLNHVSKIDIDKTISIFERLYNLYKKLKGKL